MGGSGPPLRTALPRRPRRCEAVLGGLRRAGRARSVTEFGCGLEALVQAAHPLDNLGPGTGLPGPLRVSWFGLDPVAGLRFRASSAPRAGVRHPRGTPPAGPAAEPRLPRHTATCSRSCRSSPVSMSSDPTRPPPRTGRSRDSAISRSRSSQPGRAASWTDRGSDPLDYRNAHGGPAQHAEGCGEDGHGPDDVLPSRAEVGRLTLAQQRCFDRHGRKQEDVDAGDPLFQIVAEGVPAFERIHVAPTLDA
jgi:hypothetical protein